MSVKASNQRQRWFWYLQFPQTSRMNYILALSILQQTCFSKPPSQRHRYLHSENWQRNYFKWPKLANFLGVRASRWAKERIRYRGGHFGNHLVLNRVQAAILPGLLVRRKLLPDSQARNYCLLTYWPSTFRYSTEVIPSNAIHNNHDSVKISVFCQWLSVQSA